MSELILELRDLTATEALGCAIAATARPGDRILLKGDLGSGKTTLARAIGSALHAEPALTSPTFILVSEHQGEMPIWHADAYRLAVGSDALGSGIIDERQVHGITLIEWPEHLTGLDLSGDSVLQVRLTARPTNEHRGAHLLGVRPELHAAISATPAHLGIDIREVLHG